MITKLNGLRSKSSLLTNKNVDICTPTNTSGGKWYHWGGNYRRVPHDFTFSNKMTLRTAMYQWFLVDEVKEVCLLRYLISTDLHNCKNERRNLSNPKTIISTLINGCKKKGVYVDKPSPEEINKMYRAASGSIISLSKNLRADSHTRT